MSATLNYIGIPKALPIRFVQLGGSYAPQYHFPQFDATWFQNTIQSWQNKVTYNQKIQFNDQQQLQFHATNASNGATIQLIDCSGKSLFTWNPVYTHAFTGNLAVINFPSAAGSTTYTAPMTTYHFKFSLFDVPVLNPGNYLFVFTAPYVDGSQAQAVSEPLTIAADFPGTIKFEYFNSTNDRDLFFIQTNALFGFRTEGWMDSFVPMTYDVQYNDLGYDTKLVNAVPYRKFKLNIAGTRGAPDWIFDKVNRAFACDNCFIDQYQYNMDDSGQWSMNPFPLYPMQAGSVVIRESNNSESSVASNINPIAIFTATPPPYLIVSFSLKDILGNIVPIISSLTFIKTTADQTANLNLLNGSISVLNNLKGIFYYQSNTLYYQNGIGEYYTDISNVTVYSGMSMQFANTDTTLTFTAASSFFGSYVDWGDGTLSTYATGSHVRTHTYAGLPVGAPFTIYVYYKDITSISVSDAKFNGIGGTTPNTMTSFVATGSAFTTVDASVFAGSISHLATLQFSGTSNIVSIINLNQAWAALLTINFSGNKLTIAAVNQVFNDYVSGAATIPSGGTFNTQGQVPAAPPSPTSLTSRNTLTADSWTLTTD